MGKAHLVAVIQPPIMKALTTKEERRIVMRPLRQVSKREKIIFLSLIHIYERQVRSRYRPLPRCHGPRT